MNYPLQRLREHGILFTLVLHVLHFNDIYILNFYLICLINVK